MERSPIFDVTGKFIQFLMMLVTDPGDAETDNNVLTNERPVSRSRDHSLTNQSRVWDTGDAEIDIYDVSTCMFTAGVSHLVLVLMK